MLSILILIDPLFERVCKVFLFLNMKKLLTLTLRKGVYWACESSGTMSSR